MEKVYCKKCLMRDMKGQDDYVDLDSFIARFGDELKVEGDKYESRLAICKECEYLVSGTCLKCGCYVELRAALKKNHCPNTPKKW